MTSRRRHAALPARHADPGDRRSRPIPARSTRDRLHAAARTRPPTWCASCAATRARSRCAWSWCCASATARDALGDARRTARWRRRRPRHGGPAQPGQLRGENFKTVGALRPDDGQDHAFRAQLRAVASAAAGAIDPQAALATRTFWRDWPATSKTDGPYAEAIERSLITLKALTYPPSGGIVAAPTTSLPEQFGSERNWDYRFCWMRDATLTLLALMNAGV